MRPCQILLFTILISFLGPTGYLPAQDMVTPEFGASYRIHPSDVNQTEVFIETHPTNPDIFWVACNTLNFIPFFISEGIYTSTNGGITWTGSDTCNGTPIAFHGGDPGITIDQNGTFIMTRLGRSPFVGLYSHYSTDNGATWSAQKAISTDDLERAVLATNTIPGTPGYGRTYAAWIRFANPFPMMIAHTDNGAQSWTSPAQLNHPVNRSAGGDIGIGPNGEVYLCWAGVTDVSPFKEIYAGFASSANGGESWTLAENIFPMNGITGVLNAKGGIRVNGLPGIAVDLSEGPRKGWIYIVTGQKDLAPAGSDPDIILNRSADGGKTWSSAIRVNQDALNNGKIQYFPTVHVDQTGAVNVLFYDDRLTSSDSASVFLARSTDGGDTFREYEISDHRFKPRPIGGLGQGYQGDNIDLTSTATHLWPVWMDNRTGVYQAWTVPILISQLDGIEEVKSEKRKVKSWVFPNPVTDHFSIGFSVPARGRVTILLFDPLGRESRILTDEVKAPGIYQLTGISAGSISGKQDPNGVYFYQYRFGDQVFTGKIVVNR